MHFEIQRLLIFPALFLLLLSGCGPGKTSRVAGNSRISPTYLGPSEVTYCSSPISYSGELVTVTGIAQYTARELFDNGPGPGQNRRGLGHVGDPRPIRYAEVRVTNAAGEAVQCAETDEEGSFSFTLPQGDASFLLTVNSRALNDFVKVSVLRSPETAQLFSLTATVVPSTDQNLGTLIAHGDRDGLLGGAFNIYDQILEANIFLREQVGDCSDTYALCENFTTAPKAEVYWEPGFNPGSYLAPNAGPISFYIPGHGTPGLGRLFILGGVNGDVNSTDTDHFDNSVIIHEYGHFLEDVLSRSDSPGGAHNGNSVIDPRLAWSEGFANFFQAAVLGEAAYIDTFGNIDGNTGFIFNVDLEEHPSSSGGGFDRPLNPGEGIFREMAISRFLWDLVDDTPDETANGATDDIKDGFPELWAAFTRTSGFAGLGYAFRNMGLLHQVQFEMPDRQQNWNNLRQMELHVLREHRDELVAVDFRQGFRAEYGMELVTDSSCGDLKFAMTLERRHSVNVAWSFGVSHLLLDNDFFHYRHSGGNLNLRLIYQSQGPTISNPKNPTALQCSTSANRTAAGVTEECRYPDLNLFVYGELARFGNANDIVGSNTNNPSYGLTEAKTLNLTNLPAGDYLINILGYTGNLLLGESSPEALYQLEANGALLCPK